MTPPAHALSRTNGTNDTNDAGNASGTTASSALSAPPAPPAPLRLDLAGYSREATVGEPRAFLDFFHTAEQLGFDGVWFHEFRLLPGTGPYPSPLLLAAALLARTERLRVGISALVAPLHQPLLLAEELAQLHFQSGGRLDAGVGRGTDAATLAQLGIDPASTRTLFERCCDTLQTRATGVPLYVAGSTPETLGFALARRLPLLLSLEPPEAAQLAQVRQWVQAAPTGAAAHAGASASDSDSRDARTRAARAVLAASSLSRYVCIGATRAEADAQLAALWPRLHARRVFFAARRGVPAHQVPAVDTAQALRTQFIHGTPAQCRAQITQLAQASGIGALRCVFTANGLLPPEQALAGMRLFAREVLPALRAAAA
ncbi:MAG: LLM class flavin-dependent oxidoreductase [Comamonadaceae bacterium]|nr:LLM class flavin-dependent oxidoreductase [Comamonadaceae bacterium]